MKTDIIKTKIQELDTHLWGMGLAGMAYSEPWNAKAEEKAKLEQGLEKRKENEIIK